MGEHYQSKNDEKLKIDIKSDQWTLHPKHDATIVTLKNPLSFSREIQPALLPDNKWDKFKGEAVIATGWGGLGTSRDALADKLQVVKLTVAKDCSGSRYAHMTGPWHICAEGFDKDVCGGDSGGGLILQKKGRNTIIGIVEFGHPCHWNRGETKIGINQLCTLFIR